MGTIFACMAVTNGTLLFDKMHMLIEATETIRSISIAVAGVVAPPPAPCANATEVLTGSAAISRRVLNAC